MHRAFARAKHRTRRYRIPGGRLTFKVQRPLSLSLTAPLSVLHFAKFLRNYRVNSLGATTRRYKLNKLLKLQCFAAKALSARAVSPQLRRRLKRRRLKINFKQAPSAVRAASVLRNLLRLLAKRGAISAGREVLTESLATLFFTYKSLKRIEERRADQLRQLQDTTRVLRGIIPDKYHKSEFQALTPVHRAEYVFKQKFAQLIWQFFSPAFRVKQKTSARVKKKVGRKVSPEARLCVFNNRFLACGDVTTVDVGPKISGTHNTRTKLRLVVRPWKRRKYRASRKNASYQPKKKIWRKHTYFHVWGRNVKKYRPRQSTTLTSVARIFEAGPILSVRMFSSTARAAMNKSRKNQKNYVQTPLVQKKHAKKKSSQKIRSRKRKIRSWSPGAKYYEFQKHKIQKRKNQKRLVQKNKMKNRQIRKPLAKKLVFWKKRFQKRAVQKRPVQKPRALKLRRWKKQLLKKSTLLKLRTNTRKARFVVAKRLFASQRRYIRRLNKFLRYKNARKYRYRKPLRPRAFRQFRLKLQLRRRVGYAFRRRPALLRWRHLLAPRRRAICVFRPGEEAPLKTVFDASATNWSAQSLKKLRKTAASLCRLTTTEQHGKSATFQVCACVIWLH